MLEQSINSITCSNKRLAPNNQLMTRKLVVKVEHGQLLWLSRSFLWQPTTSTTSMLILATHSLASEDSATWTLVSTSLKVSFHKTLVPYSSIKLSKFKMLFFISRTFFIQLYKFPYHILQWKHPTQLNGPCSVYCIIWSKT